MAVVDDAAVGLQHHVADRVRLGEGRQVLAVGDLELGKLAGKKTHDQDRGRRRRGQPKRPSRPRGDTSQLDQAGPAARVSDRNLRSTSIANGMSSALKAAAATVSWTATPLKAA